jgi:hypothetical protein
MAAEYKDKRTLITTVRGQYLSFATFPTPVLSHYPLPLSLIDKRVIGNNTVRQKRTDHSFQQKVKKTTLFDVVGLALHLPIVS